MRPISSSSAIIQPSIQEHNAAPNLYRNPIHRDPATVNLRELFNPLASTRRRFQPFGRIGHVNPYRNVLRPISSLARRPERGGALHRILPFGTLRRNADQAVSTGMSLAAGYEDIDIADRPPPRLQSLVQASRNVARRIRGLFPVRGRYDMEERRILLQEGRTPRTTLGAILNRHKR